MKLLDQTFRHDILAAIDPGLKATRYGRRWRFARPVEAEGVVLGKLGFTHEGEEPLTEYDEEKQDFVTALAPARQTHFSHFVVDTDAEVMAFEDRGTLIRRQSFAGAFESLLQEGGFDASLDVLTDPASLREWAQTVRVTRIHATVRNPNPGWVDDAGATWSSRQKRRAPT